MLAACRQICSAHARIAVLLVLGALLVRAMIPAGYMPDASADGFRLTLCSGYGPAEPMPAAAQAMMHHAMAGKHMPAGGHEMPEHPCVFAAAAHAITAPALAEPAIFATARAEQAYLEAAVVPAPGRGLAAPPPPPTGPPLLV